MALVDLGVDGLVLQGQSGAVVSLDGTAKLVYDTATGLLRVSIDGAAYVSLDTGGGGVTSLNTLTGAVTLAQGANITITPSGNQLTIAATGSGVSSVTAGSGIVLTPDPIVSSGSVALIVPVTVALGGTGLTTLSAGRIPFGAGTSPFGSDANLVWDNSTKRLGIAAAPNAKLEVTGDVRMGDASSVGYPSDPPVLYLCSAATNVLLNLTNEYGGSAGAQFVTRSKGHLAAGQTGVNDWLALWGFRGHDGSTYSSGSDAAFIVAATENFSTGHHGTRFTWEGTPTGSGTRGEWMRLQDGNLGLGMTPARSLDVNGIVRGQVQDSGGQVYNAKAYGLVADDSTDNLSAMNTLVSTVTTAGGGIIYFPPGKYRFSGAVAIQGAGAAAAYIRIKGAGTAATILKTTSSTADFFQFGDATNGTTNPTHCGIEDLQLEPTVNHPATGAAIYVRNGWKFTMRNVVIAGGPASAKFYYGVRIEGGSNCWWNVIDDSMIVGSNSHGVYLGSLNVTIPQDTFLQDSWITLAGGSGLYINGGSGFYGRNVDVTACAYGVTIAPSSANNSCQALFFSSFLADTCSNYGFYLTGSGAGTARWITLNDSWSATNTLDGLRLDFSGYDGIELEDTFFTNNYHHGIYLGAGSNIKVADCVASLNSQAGSNTYDGIYVADGPTKIQLLDNRCGDDGKGSGANNQRYGINWQATTTDYKISDNRCPGNVSGPTNGSFFAAPAQPVRVACTVTTTINSVSETDITGATVTFTPPYDCRMVVHASFDVECGIAGSAFIGKLSVGGSSQSEGAICYFGPPTRMTAAQTWAVDLTGGTSYVVKLRGAINAGSGSYSVFPTHTGFTYTLVPKF